MTLAKPLLSAEELQLLDRPWDIVSADARAIGDKLARRGFLSKTAGDYFRTDKGRAELERMAAVGRTST